MHWPQIHSCRRSTQQTRQSAADCERSFTLVELLVVIAIIGILIGLLLPAIQSAREAARKSECRNNLRQLGVAAVTHATAVGYFPSGGWGCSWTGDPDRGTGLRQPGGWIYNILPYIEESSLHDEGSGMSSADKQVAAGRVMQTPLKILNCPTRRTSILYPNAWPYVLFNATSPPSLARGDYAINAGDSGVTSIEVSDRGGPSTLEQGDGNYSWPSTKGNTGVSYLRSKVRIAQVTDGTSHTFLAGESYLTLKHYSTGLVDSDRGHIYSGLAPDTVRLATKLAPPSRDADFADENRFGSAHQDGCNFVYCDGSVRTVSYDIDPETYRRYGNRQDNEVMQ